MNREMVKWARRVLGMGLVFSNCACNSVLGTDDVRTDGCPSVGARDCADISTPEVCRENGQWESLVPCYQQACRGGECIGQCSPATWRCVDKQPQFCDDSGQWQDDSLACDHLCFEGTCVGSCTPGEKRCNGNTPETCGGDGRWTPAESACIDQWCNPATGSCSGDCSPGQSICTPNNEYKHCSENGVVIVDPPCKAQTCHDQFGCFGVCAPGDKQCNGNVVETCNDGYWTSGYTCAGKTCFMGDCIGECEPGLRCAGETVESCGEMGQWQNVETCAGAKHCVGGACVEACVTGDLRCQGNSLYACSAGVWKEQQVCTGQTCVSSAGTCAGVCTLSEAHCIGQTPETCDETGQWKALSSCPNTCVDGSCPGPSCNGLPETCGPNQDENCCSSRIVPKTTYNRGNDPAFPATVSEFRLDRFEVTVGRFRKFLDDYPGQTVAEGAGAHPAIAGSGWQGSWNALLWSTSTDLNFNLQCSSTYQTWLSSSSAHDQLPINCVDWYTAFAFCIWDGGRLPTEAEWHAAASGGAEQRRYPWSNPPEGTKIDGSYAAYDCAGDGSPAQVCTFFDIRPVGSKAPRGDGKFGQADLGGNIAEWTLDALAPTYPTPCNDCAFLNVSASRVIRGGSFAAGASAPSGINRTTFAPTVRSPSVGLRCARNP